MPQWLIQRADVTGGNTTWLAVLIMSFATQANSKQVIWCGEWGALKSWTRHTTHDNVLFPVLVVIAV